MPSRTIQENVCDLCGILDHRELLPNLPPVWTHVTVTPISDKRRKVTGVFCPRCVAAIKEAEPKAVTELAPIQEAAVLKEIN